MKLDFKQLTAKDVKMLNPYFQLRSNLTCDSVILDSFIWADYYGAEFVVVDDRAVLMKSFMDGEHHGALPICRKEDMEYYFRLEEQYFNEVLGQSYDVLLADEQGISALHLPEGRYEIQEMPDAADYIYDGESLRTLAGKKYHKKKNHVNAFLKAYGDRYEYRRLDAGDKSEVLDFLNRWEEGREPDEARELEGEAVGIHELMEHLEEVEARAAGVFIDGTLQAFTVGSYNPVDRMAVIHIEKADALIRGLYPFINREFLIHEFPDALLVNREDDVGLPALRKAKQSYYPIRMEKKYSMRQMDFRG